MNFVIKVETNIDDMPEDVKSGWWEKAEALANGDKPLAEMSRDDLALIVWYTGCILEGYRHQPAETRSEYQAYKAIFTRRAEATAEYFQRIIEREKQA